MSKDKKFRSSDWYNSKSHRRDTFVHRGWMRNQGHPNHLFDGRPVIGICNTWSELTPCNGHFKKIAEFVRRGVYEAGGFPLEFPPVFPGFSPGFAQVFATSDFPYC